MQKAEIISIGSELLNGKIIDTTSTFISRKLAGIGLTVALKTTIPDRPEAIIKAVKQSWERSSVLLITGGLGPTKDDITKKSVAKALGLKMKKNSQIEVSLVKFYKKLHKEIPRIALNQAFLPEGSKTLMNSWGTAPGIYIKRQVAATKRSYRSSEQTEKSSQKEKFLSGNRMRQKKKMLFMLPGVPHETTNVFIQRVLPVLKAELGKSKLNSVEINIFGIGESIIEEKIEKCSFPEDIAISYLPDTGSVKLILTGDIPQKALQMYSRKIQKLFKNNVYSTGEVTLDQALGKILKQKKLQLAVAESCTGGLLSSRIVNASGASSYFEGGIIAYSNEVKINVLDVSPALLKKYGAVSLPVATAMAQGVAKRFSCECGIGITGVAGPAGGSRKKPVGFVCVASCCGEKNIAEAFQFYGDRSFIRARAVTTALYQMLRLLKKK